MKAPLSRQPVFHHLGMKLSQDINVFSFCCSSLLRLHKNTKQHGWKMSIELYITIKGKTQLLSTENKVAVRKQYRRKKPNKRATTRKFCTGPKLYSHQRPSQLFLAAEACLAPTEKNSVITSRGIPLVSGTFKKTKTHDMRQTTAYMPKTPARPTELSITGRE